MSEGEFGLLSEAEQKDHYELIEWIASQPWSSGKVGGIGQSYYAMSQWHMGIQNPPHLACIAPHDGMVDFYRFFGTLNGIESDWFSTWFNASLRLANRFPANGAKRRDLTDDMGYRVIQHPLNDEFWQERSPVHRLQSIKVPVFSIGLWSKADLHLEGNILAQRLLKDNCKLLISGAPTPFHAVEEYESIEFHRDVLLPFYDRYLKEIPSAYDDRPPVEYPIRNSSKTRRSDMWPPVEATKRKFFFGSSHTGTVKSLNDGSLLPELSKEKREETFDFTYPQPKWTLGSAVLTKNGPDTVHSVVTFTSTPLEEAQILAGNAKAVVYLRSSRQDTDVFVKISEQFDSKNPAESGTQPRAAVVTKGCLRASHAIFPDSLNVGLSTPDAPYYKHEKEVFAEPGTMLKLEIPLRPMAYQFTKGSRIRVELANTDTLVTEAIWAHSYNPQKIGKDTYYLNGEVASYIELPLISETSWA